MNQVSDVMTRWVRTLKPENRLREAAQAMEALAVGSLPVCQGERLVGVLTDRDLVVRGMAQGLQADEAMVLEVMSPDVQRCYENQSLEEAAQQMRDGQVRRLPVVDAERRLVGMLSLGDIAAKAGADEAGQALQDISQPARPDRSGLSQASGSAGGGQDAARR